MTRAEHALHIEAEKQKRQARLNLRKQEQLAAEQKLKDDCGCTRSRG